MIMPYETDIEEPTEYESESSTSEDHDKAVGELCPACVHLFESELTRQSSEYHRSIVDRDNLVTSMKEKYRDLEEELADCRFRLRNKESHILLIETQLRQLDEDNTKLLHERTKEEKLLVSTNKQLVDMQSHVDTVTSELVEMRSRFRQVESSNDSQSKRLENAESRCLELSVALQAKNGEIRNLTEERDKLKKDMNSASQRNLLLETHVTVLCSQRDQLESEVSGLKEDLRVCEADVNRETEQDSTGTSAIAIDSIECSQATSDQSEETVNCKSLFDEITSNDSQCSLLAEAIKPNLNGFLDQMQITPSRNTESEDHNRINELVHEERHQMVENCLSTRGSRSQRLRSALVLCVVAILAAAAFVIRLLIAKIAYANVTPLVHFDDFPDDRSVEDAHACLDIFQSQAAGLARVTGLQDSTKAQNCFAHVRLRYPNGPPPT